jgi:hypothetical protein
VRKVNRIAQAAVNLGRRLQETDAPETPCHSKFVLTAKLAKWRRCKLNHRTAFRVGTRRKYHNRPLAILLNLRPALIRPSHHKKSLARALTFAYVTDGPVT